MSLKKRLGKVVKTGARAVAAYYTAGASEAALAAAKARKTAAQSQGMTSGEAQVAGGAMSVYVPQVQSQPGAGSSGWQDIAREVVSYLPSMLRTGKPGQWGQAPSMGMVGGFGLPVAMPAGGLRPRGARRVNASAASYCRRNPSWCSQVGGVGAVANMVATGQLPTVRRGRGRGISGREFRAFRRVHKVLSTFCAPRMKIRRKRS